MSIVDERTVSGADQHTWGHDTWEIFLLVCDIVDKAKATKSPDLEEVCALAESFFLFMTQCIPCPPCRDFYSFNILLMPKFCEEGVSARTWLYNLRTVIDTKVKASSGKDISVALDEPSSVFALLKRTEIAGVSISNQAILRQFMIMAIRNERLEAGGLETSTIETRNYSLFMALCTLSAITRSRRKKFSKCLIKTLSEVEGWTGSAILDVCIGVSTCLDDPPFATSGEARTVLAQAFTSLKEWSKTIKYCPQCL